MYTNNHRIGAIAFFYVATQWNLSRDEVQQTLNIGDAYYDSLVKHAALKLEADILYRMTYILYIYKYLNIIYEDDQPRILNWLKTPSQAFNNKSALDLLTSGNIRKIVAVKEYLHSVYMSDLKQEKYVPHEHYIC